jgi:hypothetical protein
MAVTISDADIVDLKNVRLTLSGAIEGHTYQFEANNVKSAGDVTIDPAHNTYRVVADFGPQVVSADDTDYNIVTIVFDRDMSAVGLDTPGNYTFAGPTVITAESVSIDSATEVSVTIAGYMIGGSAYTVTVLNVSSDTGKSINLEHNTANYVYAPSVWPWCAIEDTDPNWIELDFNQIMTHNVALENPANYAFSGPSALTPTLVEVYDNLVYINPYSYVWLYFENDLTTGTYTAEVSNVIDAGGATLDPAHDTAELDRDGTAPQVSSASTSDGVTVRVVFSDVMSSIGIDTAGNYTFAGPTVITSDSVSIVNTTTVDITISGVMTPGENYTVLAENVTDKIGILIDAAHDTATFSYSVVAGGISVMFGGQDDSYTLLNTTYEWNGKTKQWANTTPVTSPGARRSHNMAYNPLTDKILMFGGRKAGSPYSWNDTWEYNCALKTWAQLSPVTVPKERYCQSMVWDSYNSRIWMFGGYNPYDGHFNQFWYWSGTNWINSGITGPSARRCSGMVYNTSNNKIILYGGWPSSGVPTPDKRDTWEFDCVTLAWADVTTGTQPRDMWESDGSDSDAIINMIYNPNNNTAVIYTSPYRYSGGPPLTYASVWEMNCTTHIWTEYNLGASVPDLVGGGFVYDSAASLGTLICGHDGNTWTAYNYVYDYNLTARTFTQKSPTPPLPLARMNVPVVYTKAAP